MTQTLAENPQISVEPPSQDRAELPGMKGIMPFISHLEELRKRIVFCLVSLVVATALTFIYSDSLILALQKLAPKSTLFVQLSPGEVFLASFKLSMFAGLGLSLPVILYHIVRFVSPGLEANEKRYVIPIFVLSLGLFCAGVLFGYTAILPLMLNFLLDYGQSVAQNQLSIAYFLNFCTGFLFASGLIFQMPLLLLFASFLGFTSSSKLIKQWKWAIVASFLLGAIITPSADPFSQVVMASSLFGLYGFSIGLIKIFRR